MKVDLIFRGSDLSEYDSAMTCHANDHGEVYMQITGPHSWQDLQFIALDIPTAIKFSKVLRSAIADAKKMSDEHI